MTDLNELLERVKKATGPDRRIDLWINVKVDKPSDWNWQVQENPDLIDDAKVVSYSALPKYTNSVDAALDLVERRFPGTMWRAQSNPDTGNGFQATLITFGHDLGASAEGATAPLAILAALLSALISKESQS